MLKRQLTIAACNGIEGNDRFAIGGFLTAEHFSERGPNVKKFRPELRSVSVNKIERGSGVWTFSEYG